MSTAAHSQLLSLVLPAMLGRLVLPCPANHQPPPLVAGAAGWGVVVRARRSWEEERASLQAQIEALKRDGVVAGPRRRRTTATEHGLDDGEEDEEVQELKDQLNEALEKEVGALACRRTQWQARLPPAGGRDAMGSDRSR